MPSEVYIFGAGTNGELCLKTCHDHGVSVKGILDNYSARPNLNGASVIRPEQANTRTPVVVTSPTASLDIMLQLDWMGFDKVMNLSQFQQELGIEPKWQKDLKDNHTDYHWIRDRLGDAESRAVFDAVVKFRKTLETSYLAAVRTDLREQWFDEEFFVPGPHVFVDGGAYDGDTAEEFIKRCPEFREAHLFEPSAVLAEGMQKKFSRYENVHVNAAGLSDVQYISRLRNAGLPSGYVGKEGEHVLLVPLDHSALEATFIKLDVEGSEKAAILGAQQTIRKHRPTIACAVYHRPEDIWEIPQLLNGMQDYKFYLRHYTQFYHETVLYCL